MGENTLFNIVLLGGPGSGKGTQANLLQEKYGLAHLSTGALFRQEIALGTEIGKIAKKVIDKGDFCSDEITLDTLNKHMKTYHDPKGFIFDGVPRTIRQAKMMDGVDYSPALPVHIVINIIVDEDETVRRILNRAILENRSDDNEEVLTQRISNYHILTEPLIQYYQNQNKLYQINGMQLIRDVFQDIVDLVDSKMNEF